MNSHQFFLRPLRKNENSRRHEAGEQAGGVNPPLFHYVLESYFTHKPVKTSSFDALQDVLVL